MKNPSFSPLFLLPVFLLCFPACETDHEHTSKGNPGTMSVNLLAEGAGNSKARLIFWRDETYHGLVTASGTPVPYCVCLPGSDIDSYQASTQVPYNTGIPYPNTYEKLHLCGYAPQDMIPRGGSSEDPMTGDYRWIPVPESYQNGRTDFLGCESNQTGSAEQPFVDEDEQGKNHVFKHLCSRLTFRIRRDMATYQRLQFRNVRILLPDAYAPVNLEWDADSDNYQVLGQASMLSQDPEIPSFYGEDSLSTQNYGNSIRYDEVVELDTLYVAPFYSDGTGVQSRSGTLSMRVFADRSPDNFASYSESRQWDILVPLHDEKGEVAYLRPGYSYEITITFNLNSFQIQALEEDWEDHVFIDIQVIQEIP